MVNRPTHRGRLHLILNEFVLCVARALCAGIAIRDPRSPRSPREEANSGAVEGDGSAARERPIDCTCLSQYYKTEVAEMFFCFITQHVMLLLLCSYMTEHANLFLQVNTVREF